MAHHDLDISPIPEGKCLFINELDLTDPDGFDTEPQMRKALEAPGADVIRVYIPLDLSYDNIVRRLHGIKKPDLYKARDWYCADFRMQVDQLVKQLEIYDQIRCLRDPESAVNIGPDDIIHEHSPEGIALAAEFVKYMEEYEDVFCNDIAELKREYGLR